MFIRRFKQRIAIATLAACVPLMVGCASTNRFVVDPALVSTLTVERVWSDNRDVTRFDVSGGSVDPATMTIVGKRRDGRPVAVPLAAVARFEIRGDDHARNRIQGNPAALVEGQDWRPAGKIEVITLQSGEVRDVREIPTMVDSQGRLVRGTAADGSILAYPFADILYLQIRESHPGQTVALVAGAVLVGGGIAAAIALSEMEIIGGGGY